ncbi:hypothetical protein [Numidum massiliense]|nr:hypothetical protein [Numidum massiliense]
MPVANNKGMHAVIFLWEAVRAMCVVRPAVRTMQVGKPHTHEL